MGRAHKSVGASKNSPVCLSLTKSCCKTPRAACTAARASTVALKLSRKAAASRYSRLASASNSRISATRRVRTRRVRRRAIPCSSDFRIGHDLQRGVEIDRIIVFWFHLQMMHPNVIGCLLDSHQQCEQLGKRDAVQPKVDSGFLIALNDDGGLRLQADDAFANLRSRLRFFYERQQRKLGRGARHALFKFGNPR